MHEKRELAAGLYLVSTPIGTARDITLRALDILASADVLAAEDTRSLRRLMDIHGIAMAGRPVIAYHDHNGDRTRPRLLEALSKGQSVAYAPEAGTPMIADPGFQLARAARAAGHAIVAAPGPSAVATALTVGDLPTDRFFFAGFLPNSRGARKSAFEELKSVPATLVFYESPNRIADMLSDATEILGSDRQARLCRELTKKFEEVRSGTLEELHRSVVDAAPKGEIVVLVDRPGSTKISEMDLEHMLSEALAKMSVRDAADAVAEATGYPRREIYQKALSRKNG